MGYEIRDILLNSTEDIYAYTELFLYLADRAQNIHEHIKPNIEEGNIVISDRHFDSTVAYQMAGRGIPEADIEKLKSLNIFREIQPDLTFLLDVAPEKVENRLKTRDRIEKENLDFHKKVREEYLKIQENEPERVTRINALNSIQDVHREIKSRVSSLFGEEYNE